MTRAFPWLVCLLVVGAMGWPWPLHPLDVLGSPVVEADNHVWMLWRATLAPGAWSGWPEGDVRPVQDLVHVAPFFVLDPAVAWGLALLADVVVAFVGGVLLAREVGAERGAVVGGVVLATAPVVSGAVVFGLSEAWPIGWYAVHVALVLRAARTGSVAWAVASGAALGVFGLSGWYNASFALLGAPVVAWWVTVHGGARGRTLVVLVVAAAVATALVIPALVGFVSDGDVVGLIAREAPEVRFRGDWRHAPPGGTDPLNLLMPTTHRTELSRSAYLGLASLVLAVVGMRARALLPAVAGLAWFAVLALGRELTLAGHPVGLPLPAAGAVALMPPLAGISGWYRAAAPAMVFLAPLAARGAERVGRHAPWLALLVAVDALWLCDAPWPRPHYDPRPPAELVAVPGSGPALLLPFDTGERRWPAGVPRAYQRWQPWLRRPVSESYEAADPLLASPVVAWADRECRGGRSRVDGRFPPPAAPPEAPPADPSAEVADLRAAGLEVVVLVRPRADTPNRCATYLTEVLGEPGGDGPVVTWWALGS